MGRFLDHSLPVSDTGVHNLSILQWKGFLQKDSMVYVGGSGMCGWLWGPSLIPREASGVAWAGETSSKVVSSLTYPLLQCFLSLVNTASHHPEPLNMVQVQQVEE